jgi:hypothetical protein
MSDGQMAEACPECLRVGALGPVPTDPVSTHADPVAGESPGKPETAPGLLSITRFTNDGLESPIPIRRIEGLAIPEASATRRAGGNRPLAIAPGPTAVNGC